jgi:hypothetical protein
VIQQVQNRLEARGVLTVKPRAGTAGRPRYRSVRFGVNFKFERSCSTPLATIKRISSSLKKTV